MFTVGSHTYKQLIVSTAYQYLKILLLWKEFKICNNKISYSRENFDIVPPLENNNQG